MKTINDLWDIIIKDEPEKNYEEFKYYSKEKTSKDLFYETEITICNSSDKKILRKTLTVNNPIFTIPYPLYGEDLIIKFVSKSLDGSDFKHTVSKRLNPDGLKVKINLSCEIYTDLPF